MALVQCAECQGKVSDKATACPHCGAPMALLAASAGHPPPPPVPEPVAATVAAAPVALEPPKKKTRWFTWLTLLALVAGGWWYVAKLERDSKRPLMPIEVKTRAAVTGPGKVLMVTSTSGDHLTLAITLTNPSINQEKSFRLDVGPNGTAELGHKEGWPLASGDKFTITNRQYRDWGAVVP